MSSSGWIAAGKASRAVCTRLQVDTATDLLWLYERYHGEVFRLALRYGRGDVAWAEDVTQDVFVALLRSPRALIDQESLSRWFYRVTTNRCLNQLRKEAFLQSPPVRWLLGHAPSNDRTPELLAMAKDELSRAFQSVNALPVKERIAFFMLHVDGKDQTEIAKVLRHSKGYVSKLLKRAEQRLTAAGWKVEHHGQ